MFAYAVDALRQRLLSRGHTRRVQPAATSTPERPRARERRAWLVDATFAFGAMAAASLLAVVFLQLWRGEFAAPWEYGRDALQNLMIVQSLIEQPWYLENDRLGAPFGQELYDFPVVAGATFHIALIKLIALFSDNPGTVANVFFLFGFPLTALTTFLVLRRLAVGRALAAAGGVIFALTPYHFFRGEVHLFLAAYYSVPVGAWLAIAVLRGDTLFRRRDDRRGVRAWLTSTTLVTLAACVFLGSAEVYYALLALILIGTAIVLALLSPTGRRAALGGLVVTLVIGGVVVLNHAPTLIHNAREGSNEEVSRQRILLLMENYSLKPVRLLLPVTEHRVEPLAELTRRYDGKTVTQLEEGPAQSLGLFAACGLMLAMLAALAPSDSLLRRLPRGETAGAAGRLALAAIAIATIGGLSSGLALLTTEWVRSWSRMSVFLAFFGLVAALSGLQALGERMGRRIGAPVLGLLLAVVVVFAGLDQTSTQSVPRYITSAAVWDRDAAFVAELERRLPKGAAVFQAPYVPVPEYGWDHARGYLHSEHLRWSFGAMTGRPEDWQDELTAKPTELVLAGAVAAGFDALYLDRALQDDPDAAETELTRVAGPAWLRSAGGGLVAWDLRPLRSRVTRERGNATMAALRQSVLDPLRVKLGPEFGPFTIAGHTTLQTSGYHESITPAAEIELRNPGDRPQRALFRATLNTEAGFPITVRWPDGSVERVQPAPGGTLVRRNLVLQPGGDNVVRLVTRNSPPDTPGDPPAQIQILDPTLTDDLQRSFIPQPPPVRRAARTSSPSGGP